MKKSGSDLLQTQMFMIESFTCENIIQMLCRGCQVGQRNQLQEHFQWFSMMEREGQTVSN